MDAPRHPPDGVDTGPVELVDTPAWVDTGPAEPLAPVDAPVDWPVGVDTGTAERTAAVDLPDVAGTTGAMQRPDWHDCAGPADAPSVDQNDVEEEEDDWGHLLEGAGGNSATNVTCEQPPLLPEQDVKRMQWASYGVSVLHPWFQHLTGQSHTVHHAGDCSGAEAPAVA